MRAIHLRTFVFFFKGQKIRFWAGLDLELDLEYGLELWIDLC